VVLTTASIFGTPNVGVYALVNDKIAILPESAPKKFENLVLEILEVERVIRCTIGGLSILGILAAINNNGIVLPKIILDRELDLLTKELKDLLNVEVIRDTRYTALGNLILVNDHSALVYDRLEDSVVKVIEDILDVEVMKGRISDDVGVVGSAGVVNNQGLLLHPSASESKVEELMEFFKVSKADVGTVNKGVPFLRTGILTNNKGALVGDDSTGPELMHIGRILGVS